MPPRSSSFAGVTGYRAVHCTQRGTATGASQYMRLRAVGAENCCMEPRSELGGPLCLYLGTELITGNRHGFEPRYETKFAAHP
jgi:hypothetical protein